MAKRSKLPPKFETEVGQPSTLNALGHTNKNSATGRMIKALEEMQTFGKNYNVALASHCTKAIEEIRNTNPVTLPLNEWRGWAVTDDHTGLTLVVRLRRIK